MVGSPKNLSDLRRIKAQVQVTCTTCKATEIWELDALITEVHNNGGNSDWHTATYAVKCPRRCASPIISLLPIPLGKQRARSRAHRQTLINLSLQISREATDRSARQAVGTIEVRLALHVLRPFVKDRQVLVEFWQAATVQPRHPWSSCHLPYRHIALRLLEDGAEIDEQHRP